MQNLNKKNNKDNNLILKMLNVSKKFQGVKTLNHVDLELKRREVHALVGENGAGKSTLVKILMGVYIKDSGDIYRLDQS